VRFGANSPGSECHYFDDAYGTVGKYGSIAVIERLMLTTKRILLCLPLVPL
jgi:hypothetical protein